MPRYDVELGSEAVFVRPCSFTCKRTPRTTNLKIRRIRARAVLAPFKRPPVSASGHIPSAPLVLIDLETHGGVTGRAYLFGFSPWTLKSIVGCVDGLAEMIKGDVLAPLALEAKLRKHCTLLDTPGLVGLALAGIDMAAWDALAIALGLPLVKLLGGEVRPIRRVQQLWLVDTACRAARR